MYWDIELKYRVIQRDCHKWKCYYITLNWGFIDFWGIFRFHILGGLLFKATLDPNRHFWLLWPIFWCPIVFEGYFVDFFQKHKFGSFTVFLYGSSNVGQSQLIFVWPKWCRQVSFFTKRTLGYFPFCGAHLQKASDPALQAENGPLSSRMGTFQRRRSIKVLSGYGCELWYVPTELGLPGPKKWGIVGVAWQNNWFQGLKKIM